MLDLSIRRLPPGSNGFGERKSDWRGAPEEGSAFA